ncbi:MAG: DNA translocase FtsK 4TM domain-containing protein, partial [Pseudomonadota bacterium]
MPAASRKTAFLPPGAGEFFKRRACELTGLALFLGAVGLLLALVTFHTSDPSLNTASGQPVRNLMGWPGAVVSDLALQAFGIVSALLILVFGAWGARLMRRHTLDNALLRIALLPVGLLLAALACAAINHFFNWPLDAGLGGVAGSTLLARLLEAISLTGAHVDGIIIFAVFGVLAGGVLFYVLAYSAEEWRNGAERVHRVLARVGAVLWVPVAWWRERRERIRERPPVEVPTGRSRARREPVLERGDAIDAMDPIELEPEPIRPPPVVLKEDLVETPAAQPKPSKRALAARQRSLNLPRTDQGFDLPPLELLTEGPELPADAQAINEEALHQNARLLEGVLEDFGVRGEIVKVRPGPVVTLYELEPAPGTKTSRVIGLSDDIARSMSAVSVRIAVIPGRNVIGIELPNRRRETVYLRELLASSTYEKTGGKLLLTLGKDIGGSPVITDLARMPHLLIAGTTGSGKSVGLNAMILSLLYRLDPNVCKLIMIDPKMLELSIYDDIPHLIAPVVTDPKKAVVSLKWTVREMEERYQSMSKLGVRNIEGYNRRVTEAAR